MFDKVKAHDQQLFVISTQLKPSKKLPPQQFLNAQKMFKDRNQNQKKSKKIAEKEYDSEQNKVRSASVSFDASLSPHGESSPEKATSLKSEQKENAEMNDSRPGSVLELQNNGAVIPNRKMRHDQITVDTGFKYPLEPKNYKKSEPKKQTNSVGGASSLHLHPVVITTKSALHTSEHTSQLLGVTGTRFGGTPMGSYTKASENGQLTDTQRNSTLQLQNYTS